MYDQQSWSRPWEVKSMDWVSAISTVGFPAVSFLIAIFACKYVYDKERKSLDDAINKLGELTMAVEHNSEAIRDLASEIKAGESRGSNNKRS